MYFVLTNGLYEQSNNYWSGAHGAEIEEYILEILKKYT